MARVEYFFVILIYFVFSATNADNKQKAQVSTDVGTTSGHTVNKYYLVKEGEKYTFHTYLVKTTNGIKWYFKENLVATKQLGVTWTADEKNFTMTGKGELEIVKMTSFFEGLYTVVVGKVSNEFHIAIRVDVIGIRVEYRETITDEATHREWDGIYEISTRKLNDCNRDIYLCSKRLEDPKEKPCKICEANISSKPGVCEFKISYKTSANTSTAVIYYVKFVSLKNELKIFKLTTNQTKEKEITPSFSTKLVTSPPQTTEKITIASLSMTATSSETRITGDASATMSMAPTHPHATHPHATHSHATHSTREHTTTITLVIVCSAIVIIVIIVIIVYLIIRYIRKHHRGQFNPPRVSEVFLANVT